MIKNTLGSDAYCTFQTWQPALPAHLRATPEAVWLARSRHGRWVKYEKVDGQRSVALWPKAGLLAAFKARYAVVYPDSIKALEAAFAQPDQRKSKARGAP